MSGFHGGGSPPIVTIFEGEARMESAEYALFFKFAELVKGNGFVAGVQTIGRALMVHEDDGTWWMYGVKPGGMAATGSTFKEAGHEFSTSFRATLFDIAGSCDTSEEFDREVRAFFEQIDETDDARWRAAREAVRSGRVSCDADTSDLPRVTDPDPTGLKIERVNNVSTVKPDNVLDALQAAA